MATRKTARIKNGALEFDGGIISVEGVLNSARKYKKASTPGGPHNAAQVLDLMLNLVEALQEKTRVAKAAKAVHAALQEDEGLLEAVDTAYRLGGAKAVRDLLLRCAAQGGG